MSNNNAAITRALFDGQKRDARCESELVENSAMDSQYRAKTFGAVDALRDQLRCGYRRCRSGRCRSEERGADWPAPRPAQRN
ncbi:hypothetical protein RPD_3455 [Rhodopseudomonas palustris BisB5]|uniref:Uncharacterized protein n=1 Tax=Rhodopseudomonas palustris (strain BisB5) TaxID=316057 RepID=Q133R1_RHOPS|nr:hypothetical protein RPD_3455 [Rhodopseudomonas palustris BisB5]